MATGLLTNLMLAATKALTNAASGGSSGGAAGGLSSTPPTAPITTTAQPTPTTTTNTQRVQTGSYQWGNDTVPIYSNINSTTGQTVQANPVVNGTRAVEGSTPTNQIIDSSKSGAGKNYSNSDVVVSPSYAPTNGLRIGDFYTNANGVEYQIIGIGPDGNPITGTGRNNGGVNQDGYSGYLNAYNQLNGIDTTGNTAANNGSNTQITNSGINGNSNLDIVNAYAQNAYQTPQYNNRYDAIINQQAGEVINRDPFDYDYNTDPAYQAFLKAYLREGDIASNNALAQAAARTGGLPSSYAMAVSNQARDYYSAQAADRIPELYKDAFSRYVTENQMNQQDVAMMQGLENSDWNKYTSGRDFDYNAYVNQQGFAMDALNAQLGMDNTAYNRAIADRDYQLMLQQMAQGDTRYDDETQYSRGIDAYNQAMQRATLLGYVSASDAAILGMPAGTPIGASTSTSKNGGGGGGSGSGSGSGGASNSNTYYNPDGGDSGSMRSFQSILAATGLTDTANFTPAVVARQTDERLGTLVTMLDKAVNNGNISQAEYDYALREINGAMTTSSPPPPIMT